MTRNKRLLAGAIGAAGVLGAATLPAVATDQRVDSQPNGDYSLEIRVGSTTDKDRDGDRNTATAPDKLIALYTVCDLTGGGNDDPDVAGVVQLSFTFDAPGTEFDWQTTREADLERFSCVNLWVDDKVGNKWPAGTYTVTIDADNGRDTATVSGSVAIG